MKIALLMYGQPRFLNNPSALQSHKSFFLDKYDTDVFLHFWHDFDKEQFVKSDFSRAPGGCSSDYTPTVHKDAPKILFDFFKPKAAQIEQSKVFSIPDPLPSVFANYQSYSDENVSNMKSQLYSWQTVLELFDKNKGNVEYDWVVISRYDSHIHHITDLHSFQKGTTYAHPTSDIVVMDPKICGMVKPYTYFDDISPHVRMYDAAEWKRAGYRMAGGNWVETGSEWSFSLVRNE